MFEGDDFPPRAHGHAATLFASRPAPTLLLSMCLPVRHFDAISYRFLAGFGRDRSNSTRLLAFGHIRNHLRSAPEHFSETGRHNCRATRLKPAAIHSGVVRPPVGSRINAARKGAGCRP
jgi:hypothetical protein